MTVKHRAIADAEAVRGGRRLVAKPPSFAVMKELELGQFFGFDEDFVHAGFTAYR